MDELDYASAINGKMEPFINIENSHVIAMSSTAWDATKAGWAADVILYQPSNKYCGALWFQSQQLVHEPTAFINKEGGYTEQALSMITSCIHEKSERNCIVIRLPAQGKFYDAYRNYKEKKGNGNINKFNGVFVCESFLDANTENGIEKIIETEKNRAKEIGYPLVHLVYITGKLTRSTELSLHVKRYLWAWHDYRILKDKSCMQAVSQAIGRIKHYKTAEFPNGHRIRLYCDRAVTSFWENPEKNDQNIKNLSARTKPKINRSVNAESKKFYTFEKAQEFSKTTLNHTFDVRRFKNRRRDERGRIMNNIRGEWKIILDGDTSNYACGIGGSSAFESVRMIVSYPEGGTSPTFIVSWPKKTGGGSGGGRMTTYNHTARNNNAYQ